MRTPRPSVLPMNPLRTRIILTVPCDESLVDFDVTGHWPPFTMSGPVVPSGIVTVLVGTGAPSPTT